MTYNSECLTDYIKRNIGSCLNYHVEPNLIEVRRFKNGQRGVFARSKILKDETFLATDKFEGCYTEKQAFEESLKILEPLGKKKYHIDNARFMITCGLYQRYKNNKYNDILFSEQNVIEEYKSSVVRIWGTLQHLSLVQEINLNYLKEAEETTTLFNMLGLDHSTYSTIFAFMNTRRWNDFGLIPVLDLFNSTIDEYANIGFRSDDDQLAYYATRDIAPGEELHWQYLEDDAEGYWFSYGFLDRNRTQSATIAAKIESKVLVALEHLIGMDCDYDNLLSDTVYSSYRGDFRIKLFTPAPGLLKTEIWPKEIQCCAKQFLLVRNFFRMLAMLEDPNIAQPLTFQELTQPITKLGLGFEIKVLKNIFDALIQGNLNLHQAEKSFYKSKLGQEITIAPFVEMEDQANKILRGVFLSLFIQLPIYLSQEKHSTLSTKSVNLHNAKKEIKTSDEINNQVQDLWQSFIQFYV